RIVAPCDTQSFRISRISEFPHASKRSRRLAMAANFDSSQHLHTVPLPYVAGVGLDRLVNQAVERSRPHLRARGQRLHVEALSAPIQVRGELEGLVDALAQLLCAGSLSAGENGL